jgi:hypothetical protein
MKILIACEFSGIVRRAFKAKGHSKVYSCDLLPSDDNSDWHLQEDVTKILDQGWDLMIAHPPCTYLCVSGLHWNKRVAGREEETKKALDFVRLLLDAPIPKIALENPVGCISSKIRKPDQIIQPYEFGHDASKKTCLWLKGLPLLKPTKLIAATNGRWANQTASGQNKLAPSPDRWKLRSLTYEGIAQAMADQW